MNRLKRYGYTFLTVLLVIGTSLQIYGTYQISFIFNIVALLMAIRLYRQWFFNEYEYLPLAIIGVYEIINPLTLKISIYLLLLGMSSINLVAVAVINNYSTILLFFSIICVIWLIYQFIFIMKFYITAKSFSNSITKVLTILGREFTYMEDDKEEHLKFTESLYHFINNYTNVSCNDDDKMFPQVYVEIDNNVSRYIVPIMNSNDIFDNIVEYKDSFIKIVEFARNGEFGLWKDLKIKD